MSRILKNLLIISVIIFTFPIINVCASDLPPLPETGKGYYVIYKEGSRGDRIEVAFFNMPNIFYNSDVPEQHNYVVWEKDLQLFYNPDYKDGEKWFLNGNAWEKFEEGHYCISNYASDVIESNLEVKDYRKNGVTEGIIEVVNKPEPKRQAQRIWNGKYFVWIEKVGDEYKLYYSETGLNTDDNANHIDLPEKVNVACKEYKKDIVEKVVIENNILLVTNVSEGWDENFEKYTSNTNLILLNQDCEIVYNHTVEKDIWFTYKADGYWYFMDGVPEPKEAVGTPHEGYRTKDGITWENVKVYAELQFSDKDVDEIEKQLIFNNFVPYRIEISDTYIPSFTPDINRDTIYGYNSELAESINKAEFYSQDTGKVILVSMNNSKCIYAIREGVGRRSYEYDGSVRFSEYKTRTRLSLDGVNGVALPITNPNNHELNNYNTSIYCWCDDNYVYVDASDYEYYRIPVEAFLKPIIVYNGNVLAFNNPPVMESDRTLVPMRFLFEQMGAEVAWDEATNTATVLKETDVVSFSIDNATATVNAQAKTMDVPARLINDKTYIPLRFLSEELGYTVEWDEEANTVIITE